MPEGIIFQSQTAYKELRKMLVENSLVAVVSLPAGCFNPYSGVKTSILILDKSLARQSDTIAFLKVENDGFGLGAQRRAIDKNDLPQVQAELAAYLQALRSQQPTADLQLACGLIVPKGRIAANSDYNLSGERYREGATRATLFPVVRLGEVAEVVAGQSPPGESYNESGTGAPFYQGKTEFGEMFIGAPKTWTTDPLRYAEAGDILMSVRAPVGPVNLATQRMCIGRGLAAIKPAEGRLVSSYVFYFLKSQEEHIKGDAGAVFASINRGDIEKLQIPLPPLDVQKEIVAEIEGYQKVINGARAVIDNYRPLIPIHPEWSVLRFEDAPFEIIDGDRGANYPKKEDYSPVGNCLFLNTKNVRDNGFSFSEMQFISREKDEELGKGKLSRGDVVLTTRGTIGNTGFYDKSVVFDHFNIWQIKQTQPDDFAKAIIGFGKDAEKNLLEAPSPFTFSAVNERTILRLLKLIACDNDKIGTYTKLVDDRNKIAHANGNIFFSTEAALDINIQKILHLVDEIQVHSKPVIEKCYREFLLNNQYPEEREYPDSADQIREVLVVSRKWWKLVLAPLRAG